MNQSYDQVRDSFQKICSDLEYTERKLESEATLQALDTGVDVADLLKRISSIKSRIYPLRQKQLEVYWAKRDLMATVNETLMTSASSQDALRSKSGLPPHQDASPVVESLQDLRDTMATVATELEASGNEDLKDLRRPSTRQCSPDDIFQA